MAGSSNSTLIDRKTIPLYMYITAIAFHDSSSSIIDLQCYMCIYFSDITLSTQPREEIVLKVHTKNFCKLSKLYLPSYNLEPNNYEWHNSLNYKSHKCVCKLCSEQSFKILDSSSGEFGSTSEIILKFFFHVLNSFNLFRPIWEMLET